MSDSDEESDEGVEPSIKSMVFAGEGFAGCRIGLREVLGPQHAVVPLDHLYDPELNEQLQTSHTRLVMLKGSDRLDTDAIQRAITQSALADNPDALLTLQQEGAVSNPLSLTSALKAGLVSAPDAAGAAGARSSMGGLGIGLRLGVGASTTNLNSGVANILSSLVSGNVAPEAPGAEGMRVPGLGGAIGNLITSIKSAAQSTLDHVRERCFS